jgi:ABC-2 type transport system ATP-binding protein
VETLLDMVGLSGAGNRQVGTFSKGMARRIGLAQALINDPDLLILDEPTSGMDPMGTRQIKDLLVELARRGKTIFLCSHLLADVEDVCDRIGILYGGKMQVEGPVRQLLEQTGKTQIQTSQLSDSAVGQIREVLRQEQADCQVIHPMDKLESFFVRIVTKAQQEMQTTSGAGAGSGISGFLAEKEIVRQPGVLEQLVTARTPKIQDQPDLTTVKTQAASAPVLPNQDLLKSLTASQAASAVESTQSPSETTRKQVPDENIAKDMLERLRGHDKKADDTTTPINRPAAGDKSE